MPLFSIITVCRNVEKSIKRTIDSVLHQTFNDYEFIIVDGNSSDDTIGIIRKYSEYFLQKGISFCISSESDTGIYNAMNKGILKSSGQWLLFLNAGDELCCKNVLSEFAKRVDDNLDIVYGDVIYRFHDLYKYQKSLPLETISEANPFCHQSAFISRNTMIQFMYDESYKIAADFDFLLKCYNSGKKFKSVSLPVACFELGGLSTNGGIERFFEHIKVQKNNGIFTQDEYEKKYVAVLKMTRKMKFRNKLKKIIPRKILIFIRKKMRKKQGYVDYNMADDCYTMKLLDS